MKKVIALPIIAAGLMAVFGGLVNAEEGRKSVGLTLRGGVFFPTDRCTRDITGSTWFDVGAEYQVATFATKKADSKESLGASISVDYYGKDVCCRDGWGNGSRNRTVYNVPILANLVYRNSGVVLSAGAGVGITRAPFDGWGGGWDGGRCRDTKATFSYQVTAGYEFGGSTPIGIEGRFLGSSDTRLNGVGVNLFVRF
jgi:hypothetical protein